MTSPPLNPTNAVVIVPTFNEIDNLENAITAIRAAERGIHVLVVDDSSPDGTGELADRLASRDPHMSVLHRTNRTGLGGAYLAGFAWALERDFDVLIEMDADGSHPASALPALLARLDLPDRVDLVIGSRWVTGGSVVDWPLARKILSRGGNTYAQFALGIRVKDATGGYRAYRADTLRALHLDNVESHGYCFQIDMTRRVLAAGFRAAEVPITFVERRFGDSKMSSGIIVEAMLRVTLWGLERLVRPRRHR